MKLLLFISFSICAINAENVQITNRNFNVEGFYWRDYTGNIPSDALPGGMDDKGNPIYIAQAMFRETGSMVPGQIRSSTKLMTYEMRAGELQGTRDIKILCTVHPEQFQWIKSADKAKASSVLKGQQQFIIGGLDIANVVIGRATVDNEVLVGKILITLEDTFYGVHIGKNGKGFHVTSFEVLVYDPSLPQDKEHCINKTVNIINM